MVNSLIVISYNHENTHIELRDKLVMSDEEARSIITDAMKSTDFIRELAVISTCNRTEVYAVLKEQTHFQDWFIQQFANIKSVRLNLNKDQPLILHDKNVVKHLLSVAGGLKSMMLGENQILSQVKNSYEILLSLDYKFPILNRLFQEAIRSGKAIRTDTALCKGAVSVSRAVAELSQKIFANFTKVRVLLVGAGETSELTAVHFKEMGVVDFVVANRGEKRRIELAKKFDGKGVSLDKLEGELLKANIVVTATKSPDYLITYEMMENAIKVRNRDNMLLVDISSPRNIDPSVSNIGEIFLYNISDLQKVVADNLKKREKEIPIAENIVDEIANDFCEWFKTLEIVPTISNLAAYFDHIRAQELNKYIHKTGSKEFQFMEDLSKSIIRKLLHHPISELRNQNKSGNLDISKIDALWDLYHLRDFQKEKD